MLVHVFTCIMPHCWKSHVVVHLVWFVPLVLKDGETDWLTAQL